VKLAVPDMISNSYFPAIAAIELGCFRQEGLDVALELIYPVDKCYAALRDGAVDFVGGSAHSALSAFPQWQGVKLICAQAQGMYWFLVVHKDLGATRGDVGVVKGRRIGAAPWVDLGLRRLLIEAGLDLERDMITIAAVRRGVGTVVLDVRRGDGPKASFNYTMAAIATSERRIERSPETAAAAVRAIVRAHAALKENVARATEIGRKLFPPSEAELIAELIRRDLPYYDASISRDFVTGMNRFSRDAGILSNDAPYESVVAMQFAPLWKGSTRSAAG